MTLPLPSTALEDQICFSLYAASRAVIARYRPMLDQMGITYPQFLVLMVLWKQDGLTVRDLGERLELDSSTMSPLLKRLTAIGLITKERSTEDERAVHVRLTGAGRALEQSACGVSAMMIDALALDVEQFQTLKRQLDAITERVSPRR